MLYYCVTLCNPKTDEYIDIIAGGETREFAIKNAFKRRRDLAGYARRNGYGKAYGKIKGTWDVAEVQEGFLKPTDYPLYEVMKHIVQGGLL